MNNDILNMSRQKLATKIWNISHILCKYRRQFSQWRKSKNKLINFVEGQNGSISLYPRENCCMSLFRLILKTFFMWTDIKNYVFNITIFSRVKEPINGKNET